MGLLKLTRAQELVAAWYNPQPEDIDASKEQQLAEGTLPGLANLGNTCFANSVLQCLLNTPGWFPEACVAFAQFGISTKSSKAALGHSFQKLAYEYGSCADKSLPRSNSALKNMKAAIAAVDPVYAGCQQQDAYEFLGCLLEGLEEGFSALFRSPDDAATPAPANVIRAICGITSHTKRSCHSCSGCFEVDATTDTVLRLPLLSPAAQFDAPLREQEEQTPVDLLDLIRLAQQPEVIEGYDCDQCRSAGGEGQPRSSITQQAGIISATRDVLVIVLYRFGHALDASGDFKPTKVKRQVACPTQLALETGTYSLFGAVSHLGQSLTSGHYVAAVRSRRDDLWYECNDEAVKPLNVAALYDGRAVTAFRPGAEPYILFYHRQHASPAAQPQEGGTAPEPEAEKKDDQVANGERCVGPCNAAMKSEMHAHLDSMTARSEAAISCSPEDAAAPPGTEGGAGVPAMSQAARPPEVEEGVGTTPSSEASAVQDPGTSAPHFAGQASQMTNDASPAAGAPCAEEVAPCSQGGALAVAAPPNPRGEPMAPPSGASADQDLESGAPQFEGHSELAGGRPCAEAGQPAPMEPTPPCEQEVEVEPAQGPSESTLGAGGLGTSAESTTSLPNGEAAAELGSSAAPDGAAEADVDSHWIFHEAPAAELVRPGDTSTHEQTSFSKEPAATRPSAARKGSHTAMLKHRPHTTVFPFCSRKHMIVGRRFPSARPARLLSGPHCEF